VGHSYVKRLQNFCDSYLCNFGFSERDADVFYVALDGATQSPNCHFLEREYRAASATLSFLSPLLYCYHNIPVSRPFLQTLFIGVVVMKLYKCLIRPRLEYTVQAWRPYLQKNIDLIEGVQRRATKLVVETKGMSYDETLKFLDMTTLETRRVRGI
jgi:hypothetical protein